MKLKIYSIALLALCWLATWDAHAQTDKNYVRSHTYTTKRQTLPANPLGLTKEQAQSSTQYFDGLGRPIQTVIKAGSPTGKDMVSPVLYDEFGREAFNFLPYVASDSTGTYKSMTGIVDPVASPTPYQGSEQYDFYNSGTIGNGITGDTKPYSKTAFEASPLNRVLSETGAGANWHNLGKNVQFFEMVNATENDIEDIVLPRDQAEYPINTNSGNLIGAAKSVTLEPGFTFTATANGSATVYISQYKASEVHQWSIENGSPQNEGLYPMGEIYVKQVIDENGQSMYEFTNKSGQVILKKSEVASETVTSGSESSTETVFTWTYYIYDDFGNLRFVLAPEAFETLKENSWTWNSKAADLSFEYRYDGRNRMTEKRIPGMEGFVYMVYDKLDRLVLTQDPVQRNSSLWAFTKYDVFNRPVLTGITTITAASQSAAQGLVDTHGTFNESRGSSILGYTSVAYPSNQQESAYLSATYYDDYEWSPSLSFDDTQSGKGFDDDYFTRLKGQVTGSKTRILGTSDWLETVIWYDDRYRPIQVVTQNNLEGSDRVYTQYDFAGRVTKTRTLHKAQGKADIAILKTFALDHLGNVTQIDHEIEGTGHTETIAMNTYNALGQLQNKVLNNDSGSGETAAYAYNIRGWMKSINGASDPNNMGNNKLFNMELFYESGFGTAQYNGNIAGVKWQTATTDMERNFQYSYDKLNRLTAANYGFDQNFNSDEDYDVSNITYDLNGNILSLNRKGLTQQVQEQKSYGYIDQLSYSYDGNRLLGVTDGTSGNDHEVAGDFKDGNTSGNDYAYDANGNLVKDLNKGIKDGSGNGITYNHLNLPSVIKFGSSDKRIEYTYDAAGIKLQKKVFEGGALKKTTDYVGEFVYEDGELQFMHMAEGRVLPKSALPFENGDGYVYEYHYKDHLGNLRVSFREATKEYVATMEETPEETKELEEATFDQLGTRDGEFSHGGTKAVKIESTVGPYKMFKISKDDKVEASVWVYYDNPASSPSSGNYSTFFSESFGTGSETGSFFGNLGLGMKPPGTDGLNGVPLAYVQVVFYNENDEVVQSARKEIRSEGSDNWIELKASPDKAKHNGYAKVFVVNESSEPVWVDDFKITHQQLVVQENHYYPYGMNMAGIERKGAPDHLFQYNGGVEKEESFGLNWYETEYRNYDSQLGRWHQVDPLSEAARSWTPYRYGLNNPIRLNDPSGLLEASDVLKFLEKGGSLPNGYTWTDDDSDVNDGVYDQQEDRRYEKIDDIGDEFGIHIFRDKDGSVHYVNTDTGFKKSVSAEELKKFRSRLNELSPYIEALMLLKEPGVGFNFSASAILGGGFAGDISIIKGIDGVGVYLSLGPALGYDIGIAAGGFKLIDTANDGISIIGGDPAGLEVYGGGGFILNGVVGTNLDLNNPKLSGFKRLNTQYIKVGASIGGKGGGSVGLSYSIELYKTRDK
ncbi:DUF6443 domain-containing protein [Flammeovirgaceae bacterium SG7u.111]|nr:DUF6443 domain-containing protein [Flammeovirgaceae bacterium SG7u.132]WPO33910.1 DUF6443 domain-containing protein [Flammeovirgaceae bacterium SG7u.111]